MYSIPIILFLFSQVLNIFTFKVICTIFRLSSRQNKSTKAKCAFVHFISLCNFNCCLMMFANHHPFAQHNTKQFTSKGPPITKNLLWLPIGNDQLGLFDVHDLPLTCVQVCPQFWKVDCGSQPDHIKSHSAPILDTSCTYTCIYSPLFDLSLLVTLITHVFDESRKSSNASCAGYFTSSGVTRR